MKTSELTGAVLDWAVAKCEGVALLDPHGNKWELCWTLLGDDSGEYYAPSTDWAIGGAIIERELIAIHGDWRATLGEGTYEGPTPLIAAMRCYVASKLGDEVEIPKELTKGE
jgi:hypothetical protein